MSAKETSAEPSEPITASEKLDKGKGRQELPEEGGETETVKTRKSVTVEDASDSEGDDNEDKSDEEGSAKDSKEAQKDASPEGSAQVQGWQAIFSPQHNAYYFYNSVTQETTWVNPMQPQDEASSSSSAPGSSQPPLDAEAPSQPPAASDSQSTQQATSHYSALQAAAIAQGIDPALAHLDPSLLSSVPGRPIDASGIPMFTAKFNKHTGAFAKIDARDPSHLSEFERAKRMSEFYFDVGAWEKQLAEQGGSIRGGDDAQTGEKRKRLTKKDMERFKEQKKAKKLAKTAWLRN